MAQPLADKLRPTKLSDFIGKKEIAGKEGIIKKLISNARQTKFFPSLILWGPPGSGKTTLARIIATELKRQYFEFSAVSSSIKEIEKVMTKGDLNPPVVVIDEIHRYNKAQQARLLPFVERGDITLVGATTENPSFEVIAPLLSRTRVIVIKEHTLRELNIIISKALKFVRKDINKKALEFLIEASNGDARIAINTIEIASNLNKGKTLSVSFIEEALQKRQLAFDKGGDEFYNTISAFIKSMRSSDVDAALYYLARMVAVGQDPLYIARRMIVFAAEDIGMAQPTAIVIANETFKACEAIGYPECQENLAHATVYLSLAKKDRSAYEAYMEALGDVQKFGNLPIPLKVRNPVTKLMKNLDYGKDYKMYDKVTLLPEKLKEKRYYKKQ